MKGSGVASTLCGVVLVVLMMTSSTDISGCAAAQSSAIVNDITTQTAWTCTPAVWTLRVCLNDIYHSIRQHVLILSDECCNAWTGISNECILHILPFSLIVPEQVRLTCDGTFVKLGHEQQKRQNSAALSSTTTNEDSSTAAAPSLTTSALFKNEINQCFSTVQTIEGCIEEVVRSFMTGQIRILGPACCKAINEIEDNCWPMIFPFNPFFPPLLELLHSPGRSCYTSFALLRNPPYR